VTDSVTIDVYDDACKATRLGLGIQGKYDLSGNCITDLPDLALIAAKWLDDKGLTAPVPK
jgi:hypothetical protein